MIGEASHLFKAKAISAQNRDKGASGHACFEEILDEFCPTAIIFCKLNAPNAHLAVGVVLLAVFVQPVKSFGPFIQLTVKNV